MWVLFVVLVVATTSTTAWQCSSIDGGPFCPFVNRLPIPKHFSSPPLPAASSTEKLLQEALMKLLQPNKESPKDERGSFTFDALFFPITGQLVLFPGAWLEKPGENWLMIGLRGGFASQMDFDIVLPTGLPAVQCSKLHMHRVSRGFFQWKPFDGVYEGEYTCSGSKTKAKLVFVHRRNHITGTFSFISQRAAKPATALPQIQFLPPRPDRTKQGCVCREVWEHNGKRFTNGKCGKTSEEDQEPWCLIENVESCTAGEPAGQDWDWCPAKQKLLGPDGEELNDIVAVFHFNERGELVAAQ